MRVAELEDTRAVFKCGVYEVLKLLVNSLEEMFAKFEEDETLKKAMVRNMWTVNRPNMSQAKFEPITEQAWAQGLQFGSHRLMKSWVAQRFSNVDEQGFPKPLSEDTVEECQIDASYSVEPGSLSELSTWKAMAKTGEMSQEALRYASEIPCMEYELYSQEWGFEGLEEAQKLLISPKQKRLQAGIDVMLSRQGLGPEQRRLKNKRRLERMSESKAGVTDSLKKFRQMTDEGYTARQISLKLIIPRTGRNVRARS